MQRLGLLILTLFFSLLAEPTAHAAGARANTSGGTGHRGFGAGIVLGEPTGFTVKYWLESRHAIDAAVAYSFGDYVLILADYLFEFPHAFQNRRESFLRQLAPYVGIGAVVLIATTGASVNRRFFGTNTSHVGLGVRVPLGIEWMPSDPPLGVFLELAPGLGVAPQTFGFLEGGVGVRYYF